MHDQHDFSDGLLDRLELTSKLSELGLEGRKFVRTGPFGTAMRNIPWQRDGRPVVPISALVDGTIDEEKLLYVAEHDAIRLQSFEVRQGDVMFSRVADVGRCVVAAERQTGWIMSSNLMCMTLNAAVVLPAFVQAVLAQHASVRAQLAATLNSAGRDVINSSILAGIKIPVPDLSEQRRVLKALDTLNSRVAAERAIKIKLVAVREGLRDDLLSGRVRVPTALAEAAE